MERVALVTGAASGIGRAIAQRLVDDGWGVLAVDLNADDSTPGSPFPAQRRSARAARLYRRGQCADADKIRPPLEAQLAVHAREIRLDDADAQRQLLRDLLVGEPLTPPYPPRGPPSA